MQPFTVDFILTTLMVCMSYHYFTVTFSLEQVKC